MKKNGTKKLVLILGITLAIGCLLSGCTTDMHMVREDYAYTMPPDIKPPPPPTGSIWSGVNAKNALFADKKARYVNDIVTIIVDESSAGANNAKTDTNKDSSLTAGLTGIVAGSNITNTILSPLSLGGSLSNKLQGEGKTKRDSNLSAKITARVINVLGNGNLVIEGRRQLSVNAEDQYIIITGVIRPEDMTTDNTISSQYVADARIVYGGRGVVNDKMRPGWATRVMDWVWPF
jgi:flagellar L-ring protein FlgH